MKRVFAGFLSAMIVLGTLQLPAYAQETPGVIDMTSVSQSGGRLEAVLQLDYREYASILEGRSLSVTLEGSNGGSYTLPLGSSDAEQDFDWGGKTAHAAIELHNPQDAPLAATDKVGFYLLEFSGLPKEDSYTLTFKGTGYSSFTSQALAVNEFVPRLCVSAQSGGFALGDVTGDQAISNEDFTRVAEALGSSSSNGDLNLDGQVDIVDIALVHHNLVPKREAEVYEGALVTENILDTEEMAKELASSGVTLEEGSIDDLFADNEQAVKLSGKEGEDLVLPIIFENPVEMSEINIISPAVTGALEKGSVLVEYSDRTSEVIPFDNTLPEEIHATERKAGESTVVIQLGRRVPVKKITITVEKVMGEDGKISYAVVEKIEFLRDIIPENIDLGASIPKNLYAEAGSKKVSLTWRAVDNVDGYIVKYGSSTNALTNQLRVGKNEAVISGLENLKTYYFTVTAYNGDWIGDPSAAVGCIPQPDKAPLPPDNLSLTPEDSAMSLSWKKTEDALFYNVYYKESDKREFILAAEKRTSTSIVITGLTNDVSYDFYVTAGNLIGVSRPSLTVTGTPEKEEIDIPILPTLNRIDNSHIISAVMENPKNVSAEYDGQFDVSWVYDGDFETHWTAQSWWLSSRFTFEFDEEQSMDYMIYVPRLNKGYPQSIHRYSVAAWDKDGNMTWLTNDAGALNNSNTGDAGTAPVVRNNPGETGYAILPFKRNDHIKKLAVLVRQWDGASKPSSLAEVAFYTYDDIDDSIAALFTDSTYTALSAAASQERIDELRTRLSSEDTYYVNKEILLDELQLAESLLKGDISSLGTIVNQVQSRNPAGDKKKINNFQPIGVTAEAGSQIVVYVSIPEGETLSLVPTQHYAEAARWCGKAIPLENGRNVITIPRIHDLSAPRGGSLYLQYTGSSSDIRLQVRGGTRIPLLELSDWHELSEQEIKTRISAYVSELELYCSTQLSGLNSSALQTSILNATEIALPHVLLSIPASQVRAALGSDGVQTLYNDGLAWEELMQLMYRTHGIDEADLESSNTRHNIRYMRMFGNAFMYAAGNHIGIGFGSCSGMISGRPVSTMDGNGGANGLFGWGIHHEIGHVMDTLGKPEITNNIYALFGQTYDGKENTLQSRLEISNIYEGIFDKVTSGQQGMANNVFVSLGMYWQLHLAYDGADDNFYNQLNKIRTGSGDAAFMTAASQVAGKDLSEFFAAWGFTPSGQSGAQEERKIQYLTDRSRRERLSGTQKQSGTVGITAAYDRDARNAVVTITPTEGAKMQGYEISRSLNGKTEVVAFLSANSGVTSWNDSLGSVNNKAVSYSVKAVDILGYVIAEATSSQLDISHDNLIDRSEYQWSSGSSSNGVLTASFNGNLSVAGIRFNSFPAAGTSSTSSDVSEPEDSSASSESSSVPEESSSQPEESSQPEDQPEAPDEEGTAGNDENDSENQAQSAPDGDVEIEDQPTALAEPGTDGSGDVAEKDIVTVEVSTDGSSFITVLRVSYEELRQNPGKLRFFTRTDADGSICPYDAKVIRVSGLPDGVTSNDIDFAAYPGDYIDFGVNGIGILGRDYENIKAGTLIITGNFRGNPVFNTVRVYGKSVTGSVTEGDLTESDTPVPLEGEIYLFAAIPESGDMAEIDNGLWVFVPKQQSEGTAASSGESTACASSLLPTQIMAELHRTNLPEGGANRVTSNTRWLPSPTYESMPIIILED